MSTFESPFNYPEEEPEWLAAKRIEKQREKRAEKLGREIGSWGGKDKVLAESLGKKNQLEILLSLS